MIWLLGLLAVAVIAVFIWNYRRQLAAREAASAERMKAFLAQARASSGATADADAPPSAAVRSGAAATQARGAQQPLPLVSGFAARAAVLNAEQRALYALLKTGLPDHEVLARVNLAAFIQPAETITGFAREAQERRLTDAAADFLVCDKSMKAVAAVWCGPRSGKAAEAAAFAAACVASIGVRWVEISPPALPRVEEIKQRVLGI